MSARQRIIKRAFDLLLTIALFPFFLIVILLTGIAIKLDSPGPILLRQKRVGQRGESFAMFKLRSMYDPETELQMDTLKRNDADKILHKLENDPRVTRIGKVIRKYSLDELPQIFNILRGEMSWVGPRPELPIIVAEYEPWQHERFSVPPGVTGWWQVNGRSARLMHLHTEDDIFYVRHYSFRLDLKILGMTIKTVVSGKGLSKKN